MSLEGRKEGLSSARRRRRRRRRRRHEVPFREKERKRDPITSSIKITHNNHPSSSSVERFTPKPPTPKALENRKTKKKRDAVKAKVTLYLADRARERVFHVVGFSSSSSSCLDNTKKMCGSFLFCNRKLKKKLGGTHKRKGGHNLKKRERGKERTFKKKKSKKKGPLEQHQHQQTTPPSFISLADRCIYIHISTFSDARALTWW